MKELNENELETFCNYIYRFKFDPYAFIWFRKNSDGSLTAHKLWSMEYVRETYGDAYTNINCGIFVKIEL